MSDDIMSIQPSTTVAVIGAGSIGVAFSLLFAIAGNCVRVHDANKEQIRTVRRRITASFRDLESFGLTDRSIDDVLSRVYLASDIVDAVAGSIHVQECVPEDIELKRKIFVQLDARAPAGVTLASSSSAIMTSEFAADLRGAERCLVAHPGNPPFLLRVVEVVPAPFTKDTTVVQVCNLMRSADLTPVMVRREIRGFVFNRLQGAMLREAYCLVRDGIANVEEIDRIVRDGLGLRYAAVGPFEAADLNRRGGIRRHAEIMGPAYAEMGAERGQTDPWTPDLVQQVEAERRTLLPLDQWDERVRWRDRQMMAILAALRSESARKK